MKQCSTIHGIQRSTIFQYPQPRVYAMKLARLLAALAEEKLSVPSTSGLRDETPLMAIWIASGLSFQYPQPRVYAMKPTVIT